MNKKELINILTDLDDGDEIYFSYPAGDYWNSTIVKPITEGDFRLIEFSGYFEQYVLIDDDDNGSEDSKQEFVLW